VTDLVMWSLIVGFTMPLVISVIQQPKWADPLRASVTFVACAIAGGGTAYFAADLDGRTFVSSSLVVLTTALATYKSFWKPTTIAPKIEAATSPGGGGE